jgi:2,3-bisphosphoglycerate-dependent phosphoglycerate mutase
VSERYSQRPFAVPPDATEVVMVRHGASEDAVPGEPFELIEGHANPALSPVGQEQAARVAQRLAGEQFSALFTTGLVRTQQTAAPLAEALGLEPVAVPDLNEVMLGEWEGGEFRIRGHQRDPTFMRALIEERWDVVPGAETNEHFAERVRRGVETILEQAGPGVRVAAFLHGGTIGEVCRQATAARPFAFIHADNCSVSRLVVFADGRWLLRSFNDTAHLA